MMDEKDGKPTPDSDGGGGFGPTEDKKGAEKKDESGFKPTFEQKDSGGGWEGKGHEQDRKVTVYEKELLPKQQGYVGPSGGDPSEGLSGGFLYYEAGAKSGLSYDLEKKELSLDAVDAEGKVSVVHDQAKGSIDLGTMLKGLLGISPPSPPSAPSMAPFAARVTDLTSHGSPLAPGIGSVNVFIGGLPAWRATMDFHACPIVKGVVPDVGGVVMVGCPTVFVNGMMASRMGDMVVEIPGGPNPIALGCTNVMIGSAAAGAPSGGEGGGTGFKAVGEATADGLTAAAKAKVGIDVSGDKKIAEAKVSAMAAVVTGTAKGSISIPLWGDHAIILGGTAEGSLITAGVKAGAEAGYTAEKGWHVGAEAGAGVGPAGGALGFSIGFK
jgi:uncharacterized Zn-binding protein involved in type VI secretion